MLLHGIYVAELARAQHYAVEGVQAGVLGSADLTLVRTKYSPFPLYTIKLEDKPNGPTAA